MDQDLPEPTGWKWTPIDKIVKGDLLSHWGNVDIVLAIGLIGNFTWKVIAYDVHLKKRCTYYYGKPKTPNGNDLLVKVKTSKDEELIRSIMDQDI